VGLVNGYAYLQQIRQVGHRRPLALFGAGILVIFCCTALFPEYFAPYDPWQRFAPYGAISPGHPLGTNDIGNDILSEVIYGARISLFVGFASAFVATAIGLTVGLAAGYFRGAVDEILMGITDIVLIIPKIPLIIILAAFLRPGIGILILVLGLLSWESVARIVRSKTMQVRETDFIRCARCLGFSHWRIMLSDILPNIIDVLIPKFMLVTAAAMIAESSLSFLGLGDPTAKSWGMMIAYAFTRGGFINDMWWWYLPPGFCITLCVVAIVFIGFSCEDTESGVLVE
jgi:peptide/nickel transport system permease protein